MNPPLELEQWAADHAATAKFDGATFDPDKDGSRLRRQLQKVMTLMQDGRHRTLAEIAAQVDAPEASVSARLRDLRKPKFGGFTVNRRRRDGRGLHEYWIANA